MKNTNSSYILTANSVTLFHDGKTYSAQKSHGNFDEIVDALNKRDYQKAAECINIGRGIVNYLGGNVEFKDGGIYYAGNRIHGSLVNAILDYRKAGSDYANRLILFLQNLYKNPSKRAVDEAYGFLTKHGFPITEDGHILAFRKVRHDWFDFYTGKIDNSIGAKVSMPRNMVDEDKDRTCSYGLHFCTQSYLPEYHGGEGRVVVIKINPMDLVAIPTDYQNAKGRCCAYEVIMEAEGEYDNNIHEYAKTVVRDANGRFIKGSAVGAKRDSQGRFVAA